MPTLILALLMACPALASSGASGHPDHWTSIACLLVFLAAYLVVMAEEKVHLRKSVPVLLASGVIWGLIGYQARGLGTSHQAEEAIRHFILEFGELFLFLLAAMTYINTMAEMGVFDVVRDWLVGMRMSLRKLFWLSGLMAFFISPLADNLTTALLMGAVLMAVAGNNARFTAMACLNIVVAANAGGAFSPFGDITTLMVWQKGLVSFAGFFALFVPALVNWLVPAILMSLAIEKAVPEPPEGARAVLRPGAMTVVAMFLLTIAMAVGFHGWLGLPPVLGMVTGLGALKLYGFWLSGREMTALDEPDDVFTEIDQNQPLDVFKILERSEWDTLLFFAGVILCVGGLGTVGYLEQLSGMTYGQLGETWASVGVGVISAVLDNIPVMVAVLAMDMKMSQGQWLLVTLTAGVGGSLLSIGSAAGVALMGQARGVYTFGSHLKWSWAVALGYAASIWVHLVINRSLF